MAPAPLLRHWCVIRRFALVAFLLGSEFLAVGLNADETPGLEKRPAPAVLKKIRERSLSLLRDKLPEPPSADPKRGMTTIESPGGTLYWGRLFDPQEVVAFVNLAGESPELGNVGIPEEADTWARPLSFCVWKNGRWVYRQYVDNAHDLEFHEVRDWPHYFVQASRRTGRNEGDHLSWYYDAKGGKLVRTGYETWGPFYLAGPYLCTLRGFERRAVDETVWVYAYKNGKKGNLLATYYNDSGAGEIRNFAITFRDRETDRFWTFSFTARGTDRPALHFTVDAAEGLQDEPRELAATRTHYGGDLELSDPHDIPDEAIFEHLTGISRAVIENYGETRRWKDPVPPLPARVDLQLKVTGDPEITRRLK